jgi:hypothetical protein
MLEPEDETAALPRIKDNYLIIISDLSTGQEHPRTL